MKHSRRILAVLAVTSALCADQVMAAAPVSASPMIETAARLVLRLSGRFRRVAPVGMTPRTRAGVRAVSSPPAPPPVAPVVEHRRVSPFQFRLPPPIV